MTETKIAEFNKALLTHLRNVESYLSEIDENTYLDHMLDCHDGDICILCRTKELINKLEENNE